MAEKEPFGYQKPTLDNKQLAEKLDRVDELVSLLLDDELEEPRVRELESLLLGSPEARSQYVGLMQLHAELIEYYNPQKAVGATSPVLAHLAQSASAVTPPAEQPAD